MGKFKFLDKDKISRLPKNPGVYAFKKGREFLYIGKASNIRERIKNHFQRPAYKDNFFINQVKKIGYLKTGSEIEALILEANLIRKYQPRYNVLWKDDKKFFYVAVTKEDFPRIFWTHQPKLKIINCKLKIDYIGPFVDGKALKKTLRILRKIFPYYTVKKHPKTLCLACHLGLCPGLNPNKAEYRRNIKSLISILRGKKQIILRNFKKEMKLASNSQNFEKAAKIRDQIKSLEKVLSHGKIFEQEVPQKVNWPEIQESLCHILKTNLPKFCEAKIRRARIEAYDISNIQGKLATGSMVTFLNGQPSKNYYRKFKIKLAGRPNDIAMLKEVLERRFRHPEWPLPDLILIDGGKAQLNVAIKSKIQIPNSKKIRLMALAKKNNKLFIEGRKNPILLKRLPREVFNLILQLRDEAHRFAITYHRKLRKKTLF